MALSSDDEKELIRLPDALARLNASTQQIHWKTRRFARQDSLWRSRFCEAKDRIWSSWIKVATGNYPTLDGPACVNGASMENE